MSKQVKYLKPHLLEISVLRKLQLQIQEWMDMYKALQQKEDMYSSLLLTAEDRATKKYYVSRLGQVRKQLKVLGKRLNFDSLVAIFENVFKRLDVLYKLDSDLQKDKVTWSKK